MVSFLLWPLYPSEINTNTHWLGGCIHPRTESDTAQKRKMLHVLTKTVGNEHAHFVMNSHGFINLSFIDNIYIT
jgi:hypothetical protein